MINRNSGKKTNNEPVGRAEQKEKTRQKLIQSALSLVGEGSSFTALGIREITREAGVVPTAFYRHFRNTDELGLALVVEGGRTLRRLLREARQTSRPGQDMIRYSVSVFVNHLRDRPLEWRFVTTERSGGSKILRMAIRNELNQFTNEMFSDLLALRVVPGADPLCLQQICGIVVGLMMYSATDFLDFELEDSKTQKEMIDYFVRQIAIVFAGGTRRVDRPQRKA